MISLAFISTTIPNYKVWIVESLGRRYGARFFLIHGQEKKGSVPRDQGENIDIQNNVVVKNKYLSFGQIEITWIPSILWVIKNRPDIVILSDQVKILSNYAVHLILRLMRRKVVYYSHGFNHQAALTRGRSTGKLVESVRLWLFRRANAVIVYDNRGKEHLRRRGLVCPIYISNNTLDTKPILKFYDENSTGSLSHPVRSSRGIRPDAFVITFLGRLVPEKKVDFLIDILAKLSEQYGSKVHGVIIGDGPERERLEAKAAGLHIDFLGYLAGDDLRRQLSATDVVFIPGMVGLAIVEAFCARKPLITVNHDFHSPEVAYLKDGCNGILIPGFDVELGVEIFAKLIKTPAHVEDLGRNARITAESECDPKEMLSAFIDATERP